MCPEEIELVSLSTGTVAPTDVLKDVLGAHKVEEEAYQMFKKKRLEVPPTMKFHDKITKQNLKTIFNVNAKKASGRGTAKGVILKAEINLFGHMLLRIDSCTLWISWLTH